MKNNIVYGVLKTKISLPLTSKHLTYFMLTYNGGSSIYKNLIVSDDIEDILFKAANTNKEYLLIQEEGHVILNYKFFDLVNKWIQTNTFYITGHIIDYSNRDNIENGYFGLHTQCLLINLNQYRKINCPSFNTTDNKLFEVIRSSENIHDNYTPLALKKGKTYTEYNTNNKSGANLISVGLSNGLKIYNWIPAIRDNKKYLYKSLSLDNLKAFHSTLEEQIEINKQKIFFYPTESYNDISKLKQDNIDIFMFPASSFKPNRILQKIGFNKKTKVIYYDYSLPALAFKKYLISNWNGIENYNNFIKKTGFDKYKATGIATYNKEEEILIKKELDSWDSFTDHWSNYSNLNHEFTHINILENIDILDKYSNKNIFLWISNIFHTLSSHHNGYYKAKEKFLNLLEKCYYSNNNFTILGTNYFSDTIYAKGKVEIKEMLDEYNRRETISFQDRK